MPKDLKGEYFDEIPLFNYLMYFYTMSRPINFLSVLIPLFLTCSMMNGQEVSKKFFPAFSGTLQMSNIEQSDVNDFVKSKFGFLLEATFTKAISHNISIYGGLSYQDATVRQIDQTYRWPVQVTDGEYDPSIKVYFEYLIDHQAIGLPVGMKLHLGKKKNRFFLTGDFRFSYVINFKDEIRLYQVGHITGLEEEDFDFTIDKTQYYLGTGFGYEFGLGKRHLAIGPSFEVGLKRIVKSDHATLNLLFEEDKPALIGIRIIYH